MNTQDENKQSGFKGRNDRKVDGAPLSGVVKASMLVFFILYLALNYIALITSNGTILFYVVTLGRDICGVITSSIIIGICLNYTDVEKAATTAVNTSIQAWDKKATDIINNINNNVVNRIKNMDYVINSDEYPIEQLNNQILIKLLKRIEKQIHINNSDECVNDIDRCFQEMMDYYLGKCDKLTNGHFYHYNYREVCLTPNSGDKVISVKTIIKLEQQVPLTDQPFYTYKPRFNSKKEAETMTSIKYILNNGKEKKEIKNPGSTNEANAFFVEYKIPLIENSINALEIESAYQYSLESGYSFFEAYYIPEPSCSFSFKCCIEGSEGNNWDINVGSYGFKSKDGEYREILSKSGSDENSVTVSSISDVWVSEGTICIKVDRKDSNV